MSEDDLLWSGWFIASSRLCDESYKVTDTLRFHCVLSGSPKAILTSPTNKLWKPEAPSMVSAVTLASFPPALRLVHWWLHYTAWLPQNCNMNEGTGFTRVPRKLVNWSQTWFDTLNKWCPHAGPWPWRHQHQHHWLDGKVRTEGCTEAGQDHHTSLLPTWSVSQSCSQPRASVLSGFLLGPHCLRLLINQFHVN